MTEKPMTVAEVANFLRRSIKSVKRLPIPFSRVGKGRLYCCVLLAMPVGNRLLFNPKLMPFWRVRSVPAHILSAPCWDHPKRKPVQPIPKRPV